MAAAARSQQQQQPGTMPGIPSRPLTASAPRTPFQLTPAPQPPAPNTQLRDISNSQQQQQGQRQVKPDAQQQEPKAPLPGPRLPPPSPMRLDPPPSPLKQLEPPAVLPDPATLPAYLHLGTVELPIKVPLEDHLGPFCCNHALCMTMAAPCRLA